MQSNAKDYIEDEDKNLFQILQEFEKITYYADSSDNILSNDLMHKKDSGNYIYKTSGNSTVTKPEQLNAELE